MRRVAAVCALVLALCVSACGQSDTDRLRAQAREKAQQIEQRVRDRVKEVLADLQKRIPQAQRTDPSVRSGGQTGRNTIDSFLSNVAQSVDGYWTKTLTANGLQQPVVNIDWIPPGLVHRTACGNAGADAAFYCPGDDTIYVAQEFASALWKGVVRGLPGERAGYGHAAGDFGVAYVVAHEYAHNIQNELGIFQRVTGPSAEPLELQADCMAGLWGNSVYRQHLLQPGDVQEAINTALAVGDFETGSAQHHGTPEQRRDAWVLGFHSGDPSVCGRYVPLG
jgi:predicted metalloprotease